MVIELNGALFGLKSSTRDFKIGQARSSKSISDHQFRPKLHDTIFNYHFFSTNISLPSRRFVEKRNRRRQMFDISSQTKSFLKEKLRMQILSSVSSDFQTLIKH